MLQTEPVLEVAEIQGNILDGFNKDFQAFMFLRLPAAEPVTGNVRAWLRQLPARITWLPEVIAFKSVFRAIAAGRAGVSAGDLATVWMNLALGAPALHRLAPDVDQFDPVFREGLIAASRRLGDPGDPTSEGHPTNWVVGGPERQADVVLIIAADREDEMLARRDTEQALAEAAGLEMVWCDLGRDLAQWPGHALPSGHEHFGFKDGVSQPGVRGRLSSNPTDFFTARPTSQAPTGPLFSAPGQPLICAGEFVLGYDRQSDANPRGAAAAHLLGSPPPGQVSAGPVWARNGSFFVYRRLRQDVPAFNRFLEAKSAELQASGHADLSAERMGALLVGRWRSGAPVLRSPGSDDAELGEAKGANNAFGFQGFRDPGDGFDPPISDPAGKVCPAAAHIRKVNPRDLNTDQGGLATTLVRRILRRGIPYGPPLPIGSTVDPVGTDRGLLFVSYQTSIGNQFEFLQNVWANDVGKPTPHLAPDSGEDLIIGQTESRDRFVRFGPEGPTVRTETEWIRPTGGGYFFAPSRTALHTVLGGPVDAPHRVR